MSKLRDFAKSPCKKDKQGYSMKKEKYQKPNSEVLEELEEDKEQGVKNEDEKLILIN